MTWSLIARDPSGALGVAVASKFFAVGALCPAVRNGKGALSTQALINPLYARDAIAALDAGLAPEKIVQRLTQADAGRDVRQFHLIDAAGRSAAYTGSNCIDWCGHRDGAGYSLAGNMLMGPQVLDETARAYEAASGLPFAERLMAAMEAGDAAGCDKRGKQAAALLIHTTPGSPVSDLRVQAPPPPPHDLRP